MYSVFTKIVICLYLALYIADIIIIIERRDELQCQPATITRAWVRGRQSNMFQVHLRGEV